MTVYDFMNYLLYVEHSAENLQFYLWYQDYTRRFQQAKSSDRVLALEWTKAMNDDVLAQLRREATEKLRPDEPTGTAISDIFRGTNFDHRKHCDSPAAFAADPSGGQALFSPAASCFSFGKAPSNADSYLSQASAAFAAAGAEVPCSSFPPSPDPTGASRLNAP